MLFSTMRANPNSCGDRLAIDLQRGARERAGAQRHHIGAREGLREALAIAIEHVDIRENMMRKRHRLRALHMGVAGHHSIGVLARDTRVAHRARLRSAR